MFPESQKFEIKIFMKFSEFASDFLFFERFDSMLRKKESGNLRSAGVPPFWWLLDSKFTVVVLRKLFSECKKTSPIFKELPRPGSFQEGRDGTDGPNLLIPGRDGTGPHLWVSFGKTFRYPGAISRDLIYFIREKKTKKLSSFFIRFIIQIHEHLFSSKSITIKFFLLLIRQNFLHRSPPKSSFFSVILSQIASSEKHDDEGRRWRFFGRFGYFTNATEVVCFSFSSFSFILFFCESFITLKLWFTNFVNKNIMNKKFTTLLRVLFPREVPRIPPDLKLE